MEAKGEAWGSAPSRPRGAVRAVRRAGRYEWRTINFKGDFRFFAPIVAVLFWPPSGAAGRTEPGRLPAPPPTSTPPPGTPPLSAVLPEGLGRPLFFSFRISHWFYFTSLPPPSPPQPFSVVPPSLCFLLGIGPIFTAYIVINWMLWWKNNNNNNNNDGRA